MAVTTSFWLSAWGVGFVNVSGDWDQDGEVFYLAGLKCLRDELQARQGAPLGAVKPIPLRVSYSDDLVTKTVTYQEDTEDDDLAVRLERRQ